MNKKTMKYVKRQPRVFQTSQSAKEVRKNITMAEPGENLPAFRAIRQRVQEKLEKAQKDVSLLEDALKKPENENSLVLKDALHEKRVLADEKGKILIFYDEIIKRMELETVLSKPRNSISASSRRNYLYYELLPDWNPWESGQPSTTIGSLGPAVKINIAPADDKKPAVPS